MLYTFIRRKGLYPLIAKGEYDAEKSYAKVVGRFPAVRSVKDDERRHGDMVLDLLNRH